MPKNFIKRISPDHQKLKEHKHLQIFGKLLHDPNLFHANRRSISGAFAVGLFCAFIPVPFQMVIAAALAILVRVNLPISIVLVWISNPITMPPMFYACYMIGAWVLQVPPSPFEFELSWQWLSNSLDAIWQPFLLGCFIAGSLSSMLGYLGMRMLWRYSLIKRWQQRKVDRITRKQANH